MSGRRQLSFSECITVAGFCVACVWGVEGEGCKEGGVFCVVCVYRGWKGRAVKGVGCYVLRVKGVGYRDEEWVC